MNKQRDQFIPEHIDEQVDLFLEQHPDTATPTTRLIHDIKCMSFDYTETRNRVWMRLSEHMTRTSEKPLVKENPAHDEKEQFVFPGWSDSRSRVSRRFVLTASVLVATLLITSMVWVLTFVRLPGATGTPSEATTSPRTAVQHFCNPSSLDEGWKKICRQQKEYEINQSRRVGDKTITLKTAYADANRVILRIATAPAVVDDISLWGTMTMPDGTKLGGGGGYGYASDPATQQIEYIESYATTQIPEQTGLLRLHLDLEVNFYKSEPMPPAGGFTRSPISEHTTSFDFSVPYQGGRVIEVNETITAGKSLIILQRVVVSPSQTRFFLHAQQIEIFVPSSTQNVDRFEVIADGQKYGDDARLIADYYHRDGKATSTVTLEFTLNDEALPDKSGEWTLRVKQKILPEASGDIDFHFTVPS